MDTLVYTQEEYRLDEDGFKVKYVYVPAFEEWMTEEVFYFQKAQYDQSMSDARNYDDEHSNDDVFPDDEDDFDYLEDDKEDFDNLEDVEYEDDAPVDYDNMTREEAMADYKRTGINHSNHDLNDWEEINRTLGINFLDLSKRPK